MNASLINKLDRIEVRREEIHALLSRSEIIADQSRFRDLSRELAGIDPVVKCWQAWRKNAVAMEETRQVYEEEEDKELCEMAFEELKQLEGCAADLVGELQILLVPKDPADDGNVFLEIRAGTGGKEAALFAGDLLEMYSGYALRHAWEIEIISRSESELGGLKEAIMRITGKSVYSRLKFESGAHRVQRVPETESQGRIHTSACTIAILPEMDKIADVDIDPSDLRIDTFRSSGAGGQHVNKTDSAIRITHIPTKTVVECQDGRSQHKNKAQAMSLLRARLLDSERQRQKDKQARERRSMVGSGDRSERIRTYNFPQGRVTDHRIQLTLYQLEAFLAGDLDAIIDRLISENQASRLAEMDLTVRQS